MNEEELLYNKIIESIQKDKGGTKEQYENLLNSIAFHESAGTMDPSIHQFGGGPGRGKYQFEGKGGSNRILTSANRTKKYLRSIGAKVPEFVESIIRNGTGDASLLSSKAQDILVLGDLRMKKGLDLKDYATGELKIQDLWADHWWAGDKKLRDSKIKSFNRSLNRGNLLEEPTNNNVNLTSNFKSPNINYKPISDTIQTPNPIVNNNVDVFKTDFSNYLNDYINNKQIIEYNNGGSHEQNPNGGIPQGIGNNGKMNTVEEGETSFNLPDGKFVFSDRISLSGEGQYFKPSNKYSNGGIIDPPNKSKKFVREWFNDPVTRERLSENIKSGIEANKLITSGLLNLGRAEENIYEPTKSGNIKGHYDRGEISYFGNPTEQVKTHEQVHSMGNIDNVLSNYIQENYGTPLMSLRKNAKVDDKYSTSKLVGEKFNIDDSTIFGKDKIKKEIEHASYLGSNGELYPRFMEMRRLLNVKPGQKITKEHIDKLQKNEETKVLFKYYKPSQIQDILNTIAQNSINTQKNNLV